LSGCALQRSTWIRFLLILDILQSIHASAYPGGQLI
jgi:hypothetical protein